MTDRETTPELPPGLALAWAGAPPPRRGPKPAHTVEQIVATAVELADAEGAAGASLPNIAHEIGVTTNALYRYFSSKEELTVLLADAGWGPPPGLAAEADWQDEVRAWTLAVIDRLLSRPWLLDLPMYGDPVTPNRLAWTESLLRALSGAGVDTAHLLGCSTMVTGFAHAAATRLVTATTPGQATAVREHLEPHLAQQGSTVLAALVGEGRYPATTSAREDLLATGLDHVLAGVAGLAHSH